MKTLQTPTLFIFILIFICPLLVFSQLNQWVWVNGDNTINQPGTYGSIGIPSITNKPGARGEAASWKDHAGNFWLFGGMGYGSAGSAGPLSDLWKYTPSTNQWAWVKGSQQPSVNAVYGTKGIASVNNTPGSRQMSATWTDTNGNLWMFGGSGSVFFNDLWKYDIILNQWTWVSGDNTGNMRGAYGEQTVSSATNKPGSRTNAICWADKTGNLWLFGGNGYAASGNGGRLGDLWKYNIIDNVWTWMKGDSVIQSLSVYGEKAVSSISNKPGARLGSSSWIDEADNLWLFGGIGYASVYGLLNDLWKYNASTNEWVWIHGDSTVGHPAVYNNTSFTNSVTRPGALHNAVGWSDAGGDIWLFGGRGYTASAFGELNALWKYNLAANQWSFVKGDPATYVAGQYGTIGIPAEINKPGAREKPTAWTDSLGNLWLFGGENYPLNTTVTYFHNDLWKFSLISILPVRLLYFNGVLKDKKVLLKWIVEDEKNFHHYDIEKTRVGSAFQLIGSVKGMNKNEYEFIDDDAAPPGIINYRLKMVDIDGNYSYSNIIHFKVEEEHQFTLYPNPAKDCTQLKFGKNINGKIVVEIVDAGASLKQSNSYYVTGNSIYISTRQLPGGMYVLKIIFNGKTFVQSLSVVK